MFFFCLLYPISKEKSGECDSFPKLTKSCQFWNFKEQGIEKLENKESRKKNKKDQQRQKWSDEKILQNYRRERKSKGTKIDQSRLNLNTENISKRTPSY